MNPFEVLLEKIERYEFADGAVSILFYPKDRSYPQRSLKFPTAERATSYLKTFFPNIAVK